MNRLVSGLIGALSLSGCTTAIVAPANVQDPLPVFILDHGRHTSLVLPHPEGVVRYAYGDWDWYAEVETGAVEATSALLWPTRAGLGRRLIAAPATEAGVRGGLKVGIQSLHSVQVESKAVESLRATLETLYQVNLDSLKFNAAYDLAFVHHPVPYSLWHNSNHQVANWLRQLGCVVQGSGFWARWRVEPD